MGRQTDRQSDKQEDCHTNITYTGKKVKTDRVRETNMQVNTYRQTDRHRGRQTDVEADRQR